MQKCLEIEGGKLYISDEVDRLTELADRGEKCVPVLTDETRNLDMERFPFAIEDSDSVPYEEYVRMYRKLCGIPEVITVTKRLRIREIAVADLPMLFLLYDDADVTAFIEPLYPYEEEKEYTENYIKYVYGLYGYGMWIVERKMGDAWEMIGRAGIERKNDRLEMGYMLGKSFWHKGYAREACDAVLCYVWTHTDEDAVYCIADQKNKASIRLLETLGFLPYAENGSEESKDCYIKKRPDGL